VALKFKFVETVCITLLWVSIMCILAGLRFRRNELTDRRESLFNITAIAQMEQANVLDALPEGIIIVNPD